MSIISTADSFFQLSTNWVRPLPCWQPSVL